MPAVTWARLIGVFVAALFVQVAILNQLVIFGVHPELMVLLPVAGGFIAGPQRGASIGFVAGLFTDLAVQLPFGLSSLTYVLAGFTAGLIARASGTSELTAGEAFSCAVLGTATSALYVLLGTVIGQSGLLSSQTLQALAVVGVAALLLSYPVLKMIRWCVRGSSSSYSVPTGGSALG